MEFRNNFQELKSQIEYLSSLNKEDVTHIIKSSIYELESLKVFNEEELNEINKVTLISEPFNNLFFKYNKERLINKGVVFIEEENDLQFIISLFYFFNQRVPILFQTNSKHLFDNLWSILKRIFQGCISFYLDLIWRVVYK